MLKNNFLFKVAVTLLVLPAVLWLTRIGVADFLRLEPGSYIEAVQKGSERLVPAELLASRERLLQARSWDTGNPLIPEYLGQIAVMRAQLVTLSPSLQAVFLREAIGEFEAAIALRPNSAYLWADRASAGSALLEADAGRDPLLAQRELPLVITAFSRASKLGPWEPKVLDQLVRVGRLRYAEFTPEGRLLVDAAIERSEKLGLKI